MGQDVIFTYFQAEENTYATHLLNATEKQKLEICKYWLRRSQYCNIFNMQDRTNMNFKGKY